MAKIPDSPMEITEAFAQDYKALFGDELVSVILFGSGASGTYVPKKSDINFLIVVTETGIQHLSACFPVIEKWQRYNVSVPLFMTRQYIQNSLDSFPLEFLNMKKNHRMIYGEDILNGLEIPRENIRLECETQLKGKLLHLRKDFLATLANRKALELLIMKSVPVFAAVFKGLLLLKDAEPSADASANAVIMTTAEKFGLDLALFEQILQISENKIRLTSEELIKIIETYILQMRKLALLVDELK